jgi:hypothetical protein
VGVITLLLVVASPYFIGFVFNNVNTANTWSYSVLQTAVTYTGAVLLFVISNNLIASTGDGRGTLGYVFKGTMVSLTPITLFYIPFILLTNVLTLQEVFIVDFLHSALFVWSVMLIVLMVMQIHDYKFSEAVKNLLLTVFTMIVIFVICVVIFVLGKELIEYIIRVVEEVVLRVI